MRVLGLVVLFLVGLGGDSVWAEKAKAKDAAKVYNRAGEQGQVVLKIKEGQVMRVVKTEGRWLKVNVSGRTGWIPRSKVDLIKEDEMARNTRRRPFVDGRSTKRGFGGQGGPDDRVGADATEGGGTAKVTDEGEDGEDGDKKPTKKKPVDDEDGDKKPTKKKPTKSDDGDTDGEEPKDAKVTEDEESGDTRPRAKVKKKTAIYSEPDDESEASFTATTAMTLRLTGKKKGKYLEVENDEADIGYVLESNLEVTAADSGERGGPTKGQIDVRGRLGVTLLQQGMRTVGGGVAQPDNYNLKSSAATIALGGQYLRPYSKAYVIGAELAIDIAKAVPGIKVDAMNTTGITMYNVNARAMFGKDFKRKSGLMAFGRLGFRFNSYQVADVGNLMKNTAKLPSEIIKAPTLGGALAIPKLTDKIGLRFSLDAILLAAALQQTKGLEDGDAKNVKGATLGAGLTYRWKKNMDINAAYDLNYLKFDFGTPGPARGHTGTSVGRTDVFHGVTVGVAMAL